MAKADCERVDEREAFIGQVRLVLAALCYRCPHRVDAHDANCLECCPIHRVVGRRSPAPGWQRVELLPGEENFRVWDDKSDPKKTGLKTVLER